jgi:Protein of unknown function (DUF3035)
MHHNQLAKLAILAIALALAGCGNSFRESLGLNRTAPDEFQVIAHAPLSMPPDIALRPPAPGAPLPQQPSTRVLGQSIVIGSSGEPEPTIDLSDRSPGEAALLTGLGATDVDPNIRQIVEEETASQVERDRSVISQLNFWQTPEPPTEGDTPIIERKKGLLEGIF